MSKERRTLPHDRRFVIDEAKFSTQRMVTYIVLLVFATVTANVLMRDDQAERSTIIQTVINFALLAVGYWLGSSKQGQEQAQSVSRIAESAPAVAAAVVAKAAAVPTNPAKVDDMSVTAETVTVNKDEGKP